MITDTTFFTNEPGYTAKTLYAKVYISQFKEGELDFGEVIKRQINAR